MDKILNEEFINFLNESHSEFHAVDNLKKLLIKNGFTELKEEEKMNLTKGKSYFLIRDLNSIIAFKIPNELEKIKFSICAAHTDSPTFKIKENPSLTDHYYEKLKVEGYGGMIISSWLDKKLSFAGRLIVDSKEGIKSILVDDKDLNLVIPNVAIHQNRELNSGFQYNIQNDMNVLFGLKEGTNFADYLKKFIKNEEKVLSYDLSLYIKEKASYLGVNNEFIGSSKLDDLASLYFGFRGFIDSKPFESIPVMVGFYNEETGSSAYSGADSNFLKSVLKRICLSINGNKDEYYAALKRSFLLSADNAHAIHPNHPEKSDNKNIVELNKGVVLKYNYSMNYCTDSLAGALVKKINELINEPTQVFFNRSDVRGGGTLGSISMSQVSILSADIGLPQLAMHSSFETMGSEDGLKMFNLIKTFMSLNLKITDGAIKILVRPKSL